MGQSNSQQSETYERQAQLDDNYRKIDKRYRDGHTNEPSYFNGNTHHFKYLEVYIAYADQIEKFVMPMNFYSEDTVQQIKSTYYAMAMQVALASRIADVTVFARLTSPPSRQKFIVLPVPEIQQHVALSDAAFEMAAKLTVGLDQGVRYKLTLDIDFYIIDNVQPVPNVRMDNYDVAQYIKSKLLGNNTFPRQSILIVGLNR